MSIWSGIGVNYGWQPTYDTTQAENDFTFIKSQGVTRLRICLPSFSFSVARWQDMVVRALAHGFYVAWGVSISDRPITATSWTAWKAYVLNTLVPWAQSVGLSELILGNEFELHIDNTTLTSATVRSDIRAMAASMKSGGFSGKVSYNTNIGSVYGTPWASEGIGELDLIGCNSYDTFQNFDPRNSTIVSLFGSKTYIPILAATAGDILTSMMKQRSTTIPLAVSNPCKMPVFNQDTSFAIEMEALDYS